MCCKEASAVVVATRLQTGSCFLAVTFLFIDGECSVNTEDLCTFDCIEHDMRSASVYM